MKKSLLAIALSIAAFGASAHVQPYTHYHTDRGVVIGNQIAPTVETTYETDNQGRRIRVVETTTCTDTRVNRNNNHLRCVEREVSTQRFVESRPSQRDPEIADRVDRRVERDAQGRRVIITTTDRCIEATRNRNGDPICLAWDRDVTRDYVRRQPRSNSMDLDGNGRTDAWERLLYQGFRNTLDN